MADRSDETAVEEPRSTEEILEETERLLSEAGEGGARPDDPPTRGADAADDPGDEDSSRRGRVEPDSGGTVDGESTAESGSGRSRVRRSLGWLRPSIPGGGLSSYFSLREFVALMAVFGAGFFAGGMTIPVAGSLIGLFAVAFLVGAATSKRRYLEVCLAGCSVGAVTALFNYTVLVVAGLGGRVLVAGITASALACILGYYFGRDLRGGLDADV
ncbi:hypothetical protein [Halovivax sp.]|uniref:hypothetical protein n=1 Tax=Halovivax sp. TaxID=1935978 RepID=UPI0025C1FEAC|nr:hypothetical protein [Halovivax sp.]